MPRRFVFVSYGATVLLSNLCWRAFFIQMSFAPFYGFFTLYTRDHGYSGSEAGLLIALAVAAEIVAFYFAGKILAGRSYQKLLGFCYAVTAIRWLIVAFCADYALLLAASMLLHAFSFAIAHSCAMQFIQQFFPQSQRSRGQALYAGLIYGGGGALGAYIAGLSWQDGAGSSFQFCVGRCFCFIVCAVGAEFAKTRSSRAV